MEHTKTRVDFHRIYKSGITPKVTQILTTQLYLVISVDFAVFLKKHYLLTLIFLKTTFYTCFNTLIFING